MSSARENTLDEMLKWLRFMGMQDAKEIVSDALSYPESEEEKEEQARIAFELTDGSNTQVEIAEYISYSNRWVSYRQDEWEKLGIIDTAGEHPEHIISLRETGLYCPEIPEPNGDQEDDDE